MYFGRIYQVHDGLVDVTNESDLVTISWNRFSDHDKTMLVGSSDGATADRGKLRITLHHNLFEDLGQRVPRVRYGQVHVYNNHYKLTDEAAAELLRLQLGRGRRVADLRARTTTSASATRSRRTCSSSASTATAIHASGTLLNGVSANSAGRPARRVQCRQRQRADRQRGWTPVLHGAIEPTAHGAGVGDPGSRSVQVTPAGRAQLRCSNGDACCRRRWRPVRSRGCIRWRAATGAQGFDAVVAAAAARGRPSTSQAWAKPSRRRRSMAREPFRILVTRGHWREKLVIDRPTSTWLAKTARERAQLRRRRRAWRDPDGEAVGYVGLRQRDRARRRISARDNLTIENAFDYVGNLAAPKFEPIGPNGAQAVALMLDAGRRPLRAGGRRPARPPGHAVRRCRAQPVLATAASPAASTSSSAAATRCSKSASCIRASVRARSGRAMSPCRARRRRRLYGLTFVRCRLTREAADRRRQRRAGSRVAPGPHVSRRQVRRSRCRRGGRVPVVLDGRAHRCAGLG